MKPMKTYKPTPFMAKDSTYDKDKADRAVQFIQSLRHTKGVWAGKPFLLLPWQERIIRDLFGIVKPDGYRQFNTAYIEIPKKNGKSELAAAAPATHARSRCSSSSPPRAPTSTPSATSSTRRHATSSRVANTMRPSTR
jgi:hypothetical protein